MAGRKLLTAQTWTK